MGNPGILVEKKDSQSIEEIAAGRMESQSFSLATENGTPMKEKLVSSISTFGSSPVRGPRMNPQTHELHASQGLTFPLLRDGILPSEAHASHAGSASLFDHLVKETQQFLQDSFLSHPTLRQLLVVSSSHSNASHGFPTTTDPTRLGGVDEDGGGEENNREGSAFPSSPEVPMLFPPPPLSLRSPAGSPSVNAPTGMRDGSQTIALDASLSVSTFSMNQTASLPREGRTSCEVSPIEGPFFATVPALRSSNSRVGRAVVLARDFPLSPSLHMMAGGTSMTLAPSGFSDTKSGGFPRSVGEAGLVASHPPTAMRVEIHYCDAEHEVAKRHGLDLFLLVRRVVLRGGRSMMPALPSIGSLATGMSMQEERRPSRVQGYASSPERTALSGMPDADYIFWMKTTANQYNTFFLSVLWTACCNVFSSRGPLQIDLQHVFHRRDMKFNTLTPQGCFFTNVLHPPPSLAYGGPLHLPTIFPLSSTAVPCFVAGSMRKQEEVSPAAASHCDDVDYFITDNVTPSNALVATSGLLNHGRFFRGITSVYTSISTYHRVLVASSAARAFLSLSDDGGSLSLSSSFAFGVPSTTGGTSGRSGGRMGGSNRQINGVSFASTLPPPLCFMAQFYDLPVLSTSTLPPVPPDTAGPSSSEFELGGKEMIQYLLRYFKWQLGQKARTREWRRVRNGRSPNLALLHALDRSGGEGVSRLHGGSHPLSCCISLRKVYKYSIPRQTSMFPWKSSWELIENYNRELSSRCGDTTYPIGLTAYPVEGIEFHLQFNQLDEEEVSHPETLNPFMDVAFRNGFIAETCTIRGRAVLGKVDHTQSKVVQKLRPVLRNFLKVLRRSLDLNDISTKLYRQSMAADHASLTHKSSTTGTVDHHPLSIMEEGGNHPEEEEDSEKSMPRRLAKRGARRVMIVPKNEASAHIMLLNSLVESDRGRTPGAERFSQGLEDGIHKKLDDEMVGELESTPMDVPLMLQEMGLAVPDAVSSCLLRDLTNPEGQLSSIEQDSSGIRHSTAAAKKDSVVHDLRRGYLPESFLCRFAYYAADQLMNGSDEDDWLLIVMEMWHLCLDELEKYLHMSEQHPEKATKILRRLLSILGLPKRHHEGGEVHAVDLSQTLLVQKMQFLAYCVYHLLDAAVPFYSIRKEKSIATRDHGQPHKGSRDGVEQMEAGSRSLTRDNLDGKASEKETLEKAMQFEGAEESEDEDDEEIDFYQAGDVSCRPPVITLLTNGERFFPPPQLPLLPSTLDALMQQNALSMSTAELAVAPLSKLVSLRVYNEMCLFLHCNQGKVVRFPDFVQWVSPQDFRRPPHEPCYDDNEYLSERMKIPVEAAIWGPSEQEAKAVSLGREPNTCSVDALKLPVFSEDQKYGNPPFPWVNGDEAVETTPEEGSMNPSQPLSTDTNNVWWVLWCRALPRSRLQIIADSLRHFDQALEVIQWMKKNITPAALCLELAQASVANAMHRLLVDASVFVPALSRHFSPSTFSLRKFLQRKTNAIFYHLSPISNLLNMAATSLATCGVSSLLPMVSQQEIDEAQLRLQRTIGELLEMEIAVCSIKDLESFFSQLHRPASTPSKGHHSYDDADVWPAQLLVNPLLHPLKEKEGNDRLSLALCTISLADWFKHFALLFTKKKPLIQEAQVRMTCLAERPAGSAPCFQQLVADIKPPEDLRFSLTLSQEVV